MAIIIPSENLELRATFTLAGFFAQIRD